ncbi:MAG: hypothetical protein AAGE94_16660, partial [Acidobacteriota bacterium]
MCCARFSSARRFVGLATFGFATVALATVGSAAELVTRPDGSISQSTVTVARSADGWSLDGVDTSIALDLPAAAHVERFVEAADGRWLTATLRGGDRESMQLLRIVDGVAEAWPTPTVET